LVQAYPACGTCRIVPSAAAVPYLVQGRAGSTDHPLVECGFAAAVDANKTAAVFVRDAYGTLEEPDTQLRIFVLFG
jgi:hypothetical protein